MKRKIQQLGSSTLAVTLPAEWVREQELSKGDQLVVQRDENSGSLLAVPDDPKTTETEVTIDAASLSPESVRRAILGQYVLGRQLIRIESDRPLDPTVHDEIIEIERQLMGLGVVEEGSEIVVARCSVDPGDFELPTLMKRLWRTESTMRTEIVEALLTDDMASARRATKRRSQIEKLFYLFLRLVFATYRDPRLNQSVGIETGFPLIGYRSVAQDVVLMADADRTIATLLLEADGFDLDDATSTRLEAVTESLSRLATTTRRAVTDPTVGATTESHAIVEELDSDVDDAQAHLESARPEPLLRIQRTLSAFQKSGGHAADSLDVATNFAYRSSSATVSDET
jgi:phosphate uptake regulator